MMGGMGAEEVYKVTLMSEGAEEPVEKVGAKESPKLAAKKSPKHEAKKSPKSDAKKSPKQEAKKSPKQEAKKSPKKEEVVPVVVEEEEEAADVDDPFAMMGGMGAEEVYKVTLMSEGAEDLQDKVEAK